MTQWWPFNSCCHDWALMASAQAYPLQRFFHNFVRLNSFPNKARSPGGAKHCRWSKTFATGWFWDAGFHWRCCLDWTQRVQWVPPSSHYISSETATAMLLLGTPCMWTHPFLHLFVPAVLRQLKLVQSRGSCSEEQKQQQSLRCVCAMHRCMFKVCGKGGRESSTKAECEPRTWGGQSVAGWRYSSST